MRIMWGHYQALFRDQRFLMSFVASIIILTLALILNYFAGMYATENASNAVTDLILSNIRMYDVDFIFVYGSITFWIGIAALLLKDPRRVPFALKSISLFIVVRAFFITLTHIGPFPTASVPDTNVIFNKITFAGDLFFSGHTGLPFLLCLIFWGDLRLRYGFLIASFVFGVSAILGHYHYSIDVFAAYFITYSIFHIAKVLFPGDLRRFQTSVLTA
jgi:hypothetical protein